MASNEQIELSREVDATQIPSGIPHRLAAGTKARLMQALGGSYTVMTDMGYMVRVDAKDADALGLTPTSAATAMSGDGSVAPAAPSLLGSRSTCAHGTSGRGTL